MYTLRIDDVTMNKTEASEFQTLYSSKTLKHSHVLKISKEIKNILGSHILFT